VASQKSVTNLSSCKRETPRRKGVALPNILKGHRFKVICSASFNWLLDGSIVGVYLLVTMVAGLMVRENLTFICDQFYAQKSHHPSDLSRKLLRQDGKQEDGDAIARANVL
jgi:hypothetical protein